MNNSYPLQNSGVNSVIQSSELFYNSRDVKFLEMSLLSESSDADRKDNDGIKVLSLSLS
jgi:hypothetical protein